MDIALNTFKKKRETIGFKRFLELYYEPVEIFQITPTNAPEIDKNNFRNRSKKVSDFEDDIYSKGQTSDMLLNTIHGLFSKFYAPERIRLNKKGLRIKMNDIVSYKVTITNGEMKFYLTVPKKWSKSFVSAIKKDWGQVDVVKIDEKIIDFNPNKTRAMEVYLRHHYALSLKYDKSQSDPLISSFASISSLLGENEKVMVDYNIEPANEKWKEKASGKVEKFKNGKVPARDDSFTINGIIGKTFDMFNIVLDEFINMIDDLVGMDKKGEEKKEQLFELKYSNHKVHANSKGYKMQIRVLSESDDDKKSKHVLKNIETSFNTLNGDNKFTVSHIKTKRGIKSMIKAVDENKPLLNKTKDVYFDKEIKNVLRMPSKETLKEYKNVIEQDSFTRTEIDDDFFDRENGAIPIGTTLEKEPRTIYIGGYQRDWWTEKGRYVKAKTRLDDRSTATMVMGGQGGGKSSASENQALYTFGAHLPDREIWKEQSKSAVVFDVADGAMISNIYNRIPDWLKDRVVVLNHSNFNNPIAVNNADLSEFNQETMKDDDYAYTLAEMEAKLVLEILESEKTMSMNRWFTSALQAIHSIDKDWGYIEAMRTLIDDDFMEVEIIPNVKNKRLKLEMETYHNMSMNGKTTKIIETIENRFSQLERDQKLWDCIAQKPLRNDDGTVKLNFRKLMDGDDEGAYLVLVYIPKAGVSTMHRKFIFAHYFTKVWNVALSREAGFAGREYRPETLVIIDEIHQIIDIPLIGKLFIDLFKEPRKYSLRLWITLHGWSSLAKAGRGIENDIKQSIMDNGCNLLMLRGGGDAFNSLGDFLQPMTLADFNNLMNMDFCGIFAVRWKNKNHVFQARLTKHLEKNNDFTKYNDTDSNFLATYHSSFGREKDEVRDENLERSYEMIEQSIVGGFSEEVGESDWESLEKGGMKEKKSKE